MSKNMHLLSKRSIPHRAVLRGFSNQCRQHREEVNAPSNCIILLLLVNDNASVFKYPQNVHTREAEIDSPQHPRLLGLDDIEKHEDRMEQVVPALG